MSLAHLIYSAGLALATTAHTDGQVVTYEGQSFLDEQGWQRSPFCEPERWIDDGWLVQRVEPPIPECGQPPYGDWDSYRRSIAEFNDAEAFFLEWRLLSDGERSEFPGAAPAVMAAASYGDVRYNFTLARDQVKFLRDPDLPSHFVDIAPDVIHTHRLELYADQLYVWYIDGEVVESGVPEGHYPSFRPEVIWHVASWWLTNQTFLDYIRYGRIPDDGSSDFDSDEDVDLSDARYFAECLDVGWGGGAGGPDADAGPGCRWADADGDTDVDLSDFAAFQNRFTGSQ